MIRKAMRAVVGLCLATAMGAQAQTPAPAGPDVRLDAVMGGDADGFRQADRPRTFHFPQDHGPHDGFRTEWWYLTGHLDGPGGEWFGVQLTFFRFALRPGDDAQSADGSPWRTRHAWMGHLALTDVEGAAFEADERFAREALGLAGAEAEPFAVWLEDWRLEALAGSPARWRARAGSGDIAIDLELDASAPPVLNGTAGLSPKGHTPGNASYYYSMPRLPSAGSVRTPRGEFAVNGTLWLDREWSTSALEEGIEGWDWFALQLTDGRDLMLYQLRREDGSAHPASAGTRVDADRTPAALVAGDFTVEVTDHWRSDETGRRYPARWRLGLRETGETLVVVPVMAAQEHTGLFDYWEGAVRVLDASGRSLGRGYVEMTGYR